MIVGGREVGPEHQAIQGGIPDGAVFTPVFTPQELDIRRRAIAQHMLARIDTFWDNKSPRPYQRETVETFVSAYTQRAELGEAALQAACIQYPGAGKTIEAAFIADLMGVGKQLIPSQPPVSAIYTAPNIHLLRQMRGDSASGQPKGLKLVAPHISSTVVSTRNKSLAGDMLLMSRAMLASRLGHSSARRPAFEYADIVFFDEADLFFGPEALKAVQCFQRRGATTIALTACDSVTRQTHANKTSLLTTWPDVIDRRNLVDGIEDGYLRPAAVYGLGIDLAVPPDILALPTALQSIAIRTFVGNHVEVMAAEAAQLLTSFGLKTLVFNRAGDSSKRSRDLATHLDARTVWNHATKTTAVQRAEAIGSFRKDSSQAIHELEEGVLDLISSAKLGERGVDIDGVRGLVLTGCSMSESRVIQQVGRALRNTDPKTKDQLAVIVYIDYGSLAREFISSKPQVTPFDILDLPRRQGAIAGRGPGRGILSPNTELPEELKAALKSLTARNKVSRRGRYYQYRTLQDRENNLDEVAAWTHSDVAVLRRVLRTGGYPIHQTLHKGKRVEACSDTALSFLDAVMAPTGSRHIRQIAQELGITRDAVVRRIAKLGLTDFGQPAYPRRGPLSSYNLTPDHFSAEYTTRIKNPHFETTDFFDGRQDVAIVDMADELRISPNNLLKLLRMQNVQPYKRTRHMAATRCCTTEQRDATIASIASMQYIEDRTDVRKDTSVIASLTNRAISCDRDRLAAIVAEHGRQPSIYRTRKNDFVYGLTAQDEAVISQHFAQEIAAFTANPVRTAPAQTPAPTPKSPPKEAAKAPSAPRPPRRYTYQPAEVPLRPDMKGERLKHIARTIDVRPQPLLAVIAQHPELEEQDIGRNSEGEIIISGRASEAILTLKMQRAIPRLPFGWALLDAQANAYQTDPAKLLQLFKRLGWNDHVRACLLPGDTRVVFISPTAVARLEDLFEGRHSQKLN